MTTSLSANDIPSYRGKRENYLSIGHVRLARLPLNTVPIATFYFPPFLSSFLPLSQSRANQLSLKEDPSISSFFPPSANQETNYYSKETFVFAGPLLPLLPPLRFLQLIDTLTTIKFSVFSARRGIPEKKVNRYGSRGEGEPRLWGKRH